MSKDGSLLISELLNVYLILWKLSFINVARAHLYLLSWSRNQALFFSKKPHLFQETRYSNHISARREKVGKHALMRTPEWHELLERAITIHDSCLLSKSRSVSFRPNPPPSLPFSPFLSLTKPVTKINLKQVFWKRDIKSIQKSNQLQHTNNTAIGL